MPNCFFATDLHGHPDRYEKLSARIRDEAPAAVFLGGDLLPSRGAQPADFISQFIVPGLFDLRTRLGDDYPRFFVIPGNDDPRCYEPLLLDAEEQGLWHYIHGRKAQFAGFDVYGCAYVPPTPFQLKDWERYDVSRYVDPGCVSPEEGSRSVPASESELRWTTIWGELATLLGDAALDRAILVTHAPPYDTVLDRAALDGRMHDHVPLDVHVGSIAVKRLIEQRQPLLSLHGHVHESARLTGAWKTTMGRTVSINAAHDGSELALVRFDPESPAGATRELL